LGGEGFDVLHLIGFGPYVAEYPFGQPEPIPANSNLVIQDPIAGGYVIVSLDNDADTDNMERINGLPSPNVTLLVGNGGYTAFRDLNCTLP
jgi:hypothetical protein